MIQMIRQGKLAIVMALLAALIVVSGCSTPGAGNGKAGAAVSKSDLLTINKVYEAIQRSPTLKSQTIFVKSLKGVVTLTGVVESSVERTLAYRVAAAVNGVESVTNKLTVP